MPASCSSFFAVVSGQSTVTKIYKELPLQAATITDFYNRINAVRSIHGKSTYTVPSFTSVKALFSHLTDVNNKIIQTANEIGSSYGFNGATSQNAKISGLDASKNEANLGKYLENKCYHNSGNFTAVYESVFNPSAFQSLSLAKLSSNNLTSPDKQIDLNLGDNRKNISSGIQKDNLNISSSNIKNTAKTMVSDLKSQIDKQLLTEKSKLLDNATNLGLGAVILASNRSNFSDDRSWFTAHSPRDGSCPDFSRQCSSNNSSHRSPNFGNDFNDFNDFNSHKGVVGAARNCTRDFSANCPINYTAYRVEGIDF